MINIVVNYLKENAVGKENAVKSKQIEQIFGLRGVEVRNMVNQLRYEGVPICSGRKGYWYAKNEAEVIETLNGLKARIIGIENAVNGLEKTLISK